ncbi:leucine-rich repeat domain-containing protein [uncultured Coprobacter sp.]|jgi:cell surface protein|uniref:leucine-rich repeat domain-containing protein n=1 Tax=uncultured Coprobacter sp. TaxID=1720550 RepID=UPI0025F1B625|nr:leucine-rich repeat domain-containing protein [uncultured Coprobacter sp.]
MRTQISLGMKLISICLLALNFTLGLASEPVFVEVQSAGSLSSLIEDSQKNQITDLTITGNLNGTDIRFIREMAGRDVEGNETEGTLSVLDLSGATIVSGGDYYYKQYFEYKTSDNEIGENMFIDCGLSSIVMPDDITVIGTGAFKGCANLVSASISEKVTNIKSSAFEGCSQLESVVFPQNITELGSLSFKGCKALKTFTFPKVTSLADEILSGCDALVSVTIPETVTAVGSLAFAGCIKLSEIHVAASLPPDIGWSWQPFQNVDKSTCKLFIPAGSLAAYSSAKEWMDFTNKIEEAGEVEPKIVEVAEAGTLSSFISIEEKNVIKDLTVIGDLNGTDIRFIREMAGRTYDGKECAGSLEILDLSRANIVEGGESYFYMYSDFYTKNDEFSTYFFKGCKLKTIVFPQSLKVVGNAAFSECYNLSGKIVIPEGVTSVGVSSFETTAIESVELPSSLVTVTDGSVVIDAIGAHAFENCRSLREINIPESVTTIQTSVFAGCASLTAIALPKGVTWVRGSAFQDCTGLKEIRVHASVPPKADYQAFYGVDTETCKLMVPEGTRDAYKEADEWKEFDIQEDATLSIQENEINDDSIKVYAVQNGVVIESSVSILVNVYSISGNLLYEGLSDDKSYIELEQGLYIVKTGDVTTKVVIK